MPCFCSLSWAAPSAASTPATPPPEQSARSSLPAPARTAAPGQRPGGTDDKKSQLFIVANDRDNSILVNGPADKIAVVKQAVLLLDQPSDKAGGFADTLQSMKVYRLSGLDPDSLMKTLQSQGNLDPKTQIDVDKTIPNNGADGKPSGELGLQLRFLSWGAL